MTRDRCRREGARLAVAVLLVTAGCGDRPDGEVSLRFWAMGREGDVVRELIPAFERENPGISVEVQQIPWSAAHEKLLTAFVGRSSPDLAQLGNTWIAEFAALDALVPLDSRIAASPDIGDSSYFPGILDSNRIDGQLYGLPWYVDTRLLFYRTDLLAEAGFDQVPDTWEGWKRAMTALKRRAGEDGYAIFLPLNEWVPPVVLGLQKGSPLLVDHDSRGDFSGGEFREAFAFYLSLFEEGLAPPVGNQEIANIYQEFARGYFSMFITGPWNLGEFASRLPAELQDSWGTAPLPGPDGPGVSVAGGSSLVLFRRSSNQDAAWKLVQFLSRPEIQTRFYQLTGDLPARTESWQDTTFSRDPRIAAFGSQLERAVATPKLPEWEQIAYMVQEQTQVAVRGGGVPDSVLADLDRAVDRLLEKRRWLLEKGAGRAGTDDVP